ncbi:Hypothetical protein R9X50_00470600 [Acrodontium crateriforme]|uniref:Uncharacterized protein n=1 Tax=Acrodontium crateriforme TaxID=150365 RepID=A0AAQ3M6J8_9PEZI|nr:Hypothetical protein R9X50_00470600 [Acrodontium crateriforme]
MLTSLNSSMVRLAFRLYFIIFLTLTGILGGQLNKYWSRLRLLQRRDVKASHMTGWISGFGFFTTTWDLKSIPGGWRLGSVMGITAALAFVADLLVAYFVHTKDVTARCSFGQGLVIDVSSVPTFAFPPVNGRPVSVAMNAQAISVSNGGPYGIFRKVNSDLDFRADSRDILGSWQCSQTSEVTYDPSISSTDIANDLVSRGLMYESWAKDATINGSSGLETHLVVWASDYGSGGSTYDVLISVDLVADPESQKIMSNFNCQVNSGVVDSVLPTVVSDQSLTAWVPTLQGGCYDGSGTPAITNVNAFLEQLLNAMVMVQGGKNSLLNSPLDENTQGCLLAETYIGLPVIAVGGIVALDFILVASSLILVFTRYRTQKSYNQGAKDDKDSMEAVPNGLPGWMLMSARESSWNRRDQGIIDATPESTGKLGHLVCRLQQIRGKWTAKLARAASRNDNGYMMADHGRINDSD